MIRIISGQYRGRRIRAPKILPVRPTTDRAKEGLFNILANRFDFSEIKALDLFAGTGNLSYELASRGCESIIAVDRNKKCIEFVTETSEKIGTQSITAIRSSVDDFLKETRSQFNLILADPPYDYESYEQLVELVFDFNVLESEGLLIVEHDSRMEIGNSEHFLEQRRYGNSSFTFFS
jgi:16S rRNA (guanine966-N2)-methyltransferase